MTNDREDNRQDRERFKCMFWPTLFFNEVIFLNKLK